MKNLFVFLLIVLFLVSCTEKFDLSTLPLDEELPDIIGDTVYVQIGRAWTGFDKPHDVLVGWEPMIYVADTYNDRIAMLDLGGNVIGYSPHIRRPVAIAQDRRLNLIVTASHDTIQTRTVNGQTVSDTISLAAIYKIDLFAVQHQIENAPVRRIYTERIDRSKRKYTGVGVLHDNTYFVTRRGPDNFAIFDPDNAVMWFDNNDNLFRRELWPNLIPEGTGLRAINQPSAIATFPNRPTTDFVLGMVAEDAQFKVQWITFRIIGDFFQWESFLSPERDAGADLLRQGRFQQPDGITIDNEGNIYVVDAVTDSLYRFNNRGIERFSFGGPQIFNSPRGVSVFDKTLYIADTENDRIIRYRLSTDL